MAKDLATRHLPSEHTIPRVQVRPNVLSDRLLPTDVGGSLRKGFKVRVSFPISFSYVSRRYQITVPVLGAAPFTRPVPSWVSFTSHQRSCPWATPCEQSISLDVVATRVSFFFFPVFPVRSTHHRFLPWSDFVTNVLSFEPSLCLLTLDFYSLTSSRLLLVQFPLLLFLQLDRKILISALFFPCLIRLMSFLHELFSLTLHEQFVLFPRQSHILARDLVVSFPPISFACPCRSICRSSVCLSSFLSSVTGVHVSRVPRHHVLHDLSPFYTLRPIFRSDSSLSIFVLSLSLPSSLSSLFSPPRRLPLRVLRSFSAPPQCVLWFQKVGAMCAPDIKKENSVRWWMLRDVSDNFSQLLVPCTFWISDTLDMKNKLTRKSWSSDKRYTVVTLRKKYFVRFRKINFSLRSVKTIYQSTHDYVKKKQKTLMIVDLSCILFFHGFYVQDTHSCWNTSLSIFIM